MTVTSESGPELVAFDFDETVVDCNSDTYINCLAPDGRIPDRIVHNYYNDKDWIQYMRHVLAYLHESGVTEKDIRECLNTMPMIKGVKDLIQNMKNCGPNRYELIIISDANTVFISQSLEANGIDKAFR